MKFLFLLVFFAAFVNAQTINTNYLIVDTEQTKFYNNSIEISIPSAGNNFYGQDAHYNGNQSSYADNGDGTITDNITGLMWQKELLDLKYNYSDAFEVADTFSLGGYTDWRVPTIKELYSLILFTGVTGVSKETSVPYINTDYFDFRFGDDYNPTARYIDAQYVSSTAYVSTVMNGQEAAFGLNLADGRIKGYPQSIDFEVKLVRGETNYGINNFVDNNDGTITDLATGLIWDKAGSSKGMLWEDALTYAQQLNAENYLGYNDWRVPNAKELQSIVDYSRSPSTTNSAAIDPMFDVAAITDEGGDDNFPFYWTSTTHIDGPSPNKSVYIAFGDALGFMSFPPNFVTTLYDVHGAGAQRSDPKEGDPNDYPTGHGPQGDVIRIYNYVRVVRDLNSTTDLNESRNVLPGEFKLEQNYPNPFNPGTTISFSIPQTYKVVLEVYNLLGQKVDEIINNELNAGSHTFKWDASGFAGGTYFYRIVAENFINTKKMVLLK